MNKVIPFLVLCILFVGLITPATAHKAQVVEDYKINVGWEHEPPVMGITNAVEIIVTVASDFDKDLPVHDESIDHEGKTHDEHQEEIETDVHDDSIDHEEKTHNEHQEEIKENKTHDVQLIPGAGVSGLAENLDAVISLNGEKTELVLEEQSKKGVYHATFTPLGIGFPSINLVGEIGHSEFEITFHPEKVEDLSALSPLQQIKSNIAPNDVQCKDGFQLIFSPSGRPACVTESSALKLITYNWIQ